MKKVLSVTAVFLIVGFIVSGLLLAQTRPGAAQTDAPGAHSRVQTLETRIARLEQRINQMERGGSGRWRKLRDTGRHIVMMDNETGTVKIINTFSGTVRQPKVGK